MRFGDILKIAIHNMWNNKSRTLLVTLVIFILATLVTLILGLTIDLMDVTDVVLSSNDNSMDVIIEKPWSDSGDYILTNDDIKKYKKDYLIAHPNYFSYCIYDQDWSNSFDKNVCFINFDENCLINIKDPLVSGRLWNNDDSDKNYAWITDSFANYENLKIGSELSLYKKGHEYKFIVKGIVKDEPLSDGGTYIKRDVFLSYENAIETDVSISKMTIGVIPNSVSKNLISILNFKKVVEIDNDYNFDTGEGTLCVRCDFLDNAMLTLYISIGAIAGAILLSIIIILLCIGCISNSIEITVEENKQFFGTMKAIGLRNENIKSIVRWQAIIMIIIATFFAALLDSLIMYLIKPSIAKVFMIDASLFSFSMPIYVPFIVLFLLISLVLLCTIKSLNGISKMDVVSVISEVD